MDRYKKNLHIEGNKVISYTTHVATIDHASGILYKHGYWSVTTSKHINYVAREYGLTIVDAPIDTIRGFTEPNQELEEDNNLKTIAMVMAMGKIFTNNQKEANDWDTRILRAGLEGRGLIMPDDWDSLSEEVKADRLAKVKKELK